MKINFSPLRDGISAGLGVISGGVGLWGTAAKKTLIAPDDGLGKRFMVGLAATVFTGGTGFLPYIIAKPGREAEADVQHVRSQAVDDRY